MKDLSLGSPSVERASPPRSLLRALSALYLAACLFSCVSLPLEEAPIVASASGEPAGEKSKAAAEMPGISLLEFPFPTVSPSEKKPLAFKLPSPGLAAFSGDEGMPHLELAHEDFKSLRLPAPGIMGESFEVFPFTGAVGMGIPSRASLGLGMAKLPVPEASIPQREIPAKAAAPGTTKSGASIPETTVKPADKKTVESVKADTSKGESVKAKTEGAASAQIQKPAPAAAEKLFDIPPILPSSTKIYPEKTNAEENALRTVQASIGRRIEIPFSGTSWTYLGELRSLEGMSYENRRFEGGNAIFVFTPTKLGEFELLFHRQDFIQDRTLRETVKVIVSNPLAADAKPAAQAEAKAAQEKAASTVTTSAASSGADSSAKAPPAKAGEAQAAASQEPAGQARQAKLPDTPSGLLALAKAEIEAKRSQEAIDLLKRYVELYPNGSDETLILLARLYESNGAWKNIKKSYEFYKKLRNEHPESSYWDEAERRIGYIERHYLDIR